MNLTSGHTSLDAGKSLSLHYITAVCGLALAVSAAVALGGWQSSAKAPAVAPRTLPAVAASVEVQDTTPRLVYFIVDSRTQAEVVQTQIESDNATRGGNLGTAVRFAVVTTAEEEAAAALAVDNASNLARDNGLLFQVVDMRGTR